MRKSRTGLDRKNSHRRSWFNSGNIFTMFSSAPPSPEYKSAEDDAELARTRAHNDPQETLHRQRSVSLTPLDSTIVQPVSMSSRPNLLKNNKSTFSTILSKATKKKSKHRRKESTMTQDSQSTYFDDTTSSLRRSSDRSDATTISEKDPMPPNQKISPLRAQSPPTKPLQLLECDEEEADRIQLKNDLVKLAFEG